MTSFIFARFHYLKQIAFFVVNSNYLRASKIKISVTQNIEKDTAKPKTKATANNYFQVFVCHCSLRQEKWNNFKVTVNVPSSPLIAFLCKRSTEILPLLSLISESSSWTLVMLNWAALILSVFIRRSRKDRTYSRKS